MSEKIKTPRLPAKLILVLKTFEHFYSYHGQDKIRYNIPADSLTGFLGENHVPNRSMRRAFLKGVKTGKNVATRAREVNGNLRRVRLKIAA